MEKIIKHTPTIKEGINNNKLKPETHTTKDRSSEKLYNFKLISLRKLKGFTQADLARKIGKTSEFVNMIEHGKYYPILTTRIKFAQALNCKINEIFFEQLNKTEIEVLVETSFDLIKKEKERKRNGE